MQTESNPSPAPSRAPARTGRRHLEKLAWLPVAALILGAPACRCAAAEAPAFLRARGQDIVNEKGEKVLLRGVGLGNWMLPEGYMWKFGNQGDRPRRIEKLVNDLIGPENAGHFWQAFRRNYVTEEDIRRIAELGFNSVRPALNARLFLTETDPPKPVEEGFQLLDNLVNWCRLHGLYVIIDMHGAPGGQTGQNIDDSADDQPALFMQSKYQDQLVDLWKTIARRYSGEPAVAGYDLLNEPLPSRTGAAGKYKAQVEPLYQRITRAIRDVDSRHLIILEGVDWANDWSIFTRPFDSNLIYQFHYYCWENPTRLKSIRRYLDYRDKLQAPVWVGETGERDNTIYWGTTDYFEANNIGWSFWPWKKLDANNAPCSVKRPADWAAVAAYSRGGPKPSAATAQKAFDELLLNIRLTNCIQHLDVVNSLLRRLPVRIEAENFGHGGQNGSYLVTDTNRHAEFYRTEQPVLIKQSDTPGRRSGQHISLTENEWTIYRFNNTATGSFSITLRVKAEHGSAEAELVSEGRALPVTISPKEWTEIKLGPVSLKAGGGEFKWLIKRGAVDLDWLDVTEARQ